MSKLIDLSVRCALDSPSVIFLVINYLVGHPTWCTIPCELKVGTLSFTVVHSVTKLLRPHNYYYCLGSNTLRMLTPIHSPLLFSLMHRMLSWGVLFLILKYHFLTLQNASIHFTLRYIQDTGCWTTFLIMYPSIPMTAPIGTLIKSNLMSLTIFVMRPPLILDNEYL